MLRALQTLLVMATRVFQIGYDRALLRVREMLLVQNGFAVTSALGAAEARRLLSEEAPYDAFLVGWSSTYDERRAVVVWLKRRWPTVPVVALHDAFQRPIPEADVTATHETPEEWLAAVQTAIRIT